MLSISFYTDTVYTVYCLQDRMCGEGKVSAVFPERGVEQLIIGRNFCFCLLQDMLCWIIRLLGMSGKYSRAFSSYWIITPIF